MTEQTPDAGAAPRTGGPAVLVLEDGRVFSGRAYGATGRTVGEIVFNTGMTGYQETLTDPSYHRQIVVMTAPHVGNTGVNEEDDESTRIWVAGFVVRDPARRASNWRASGTLDDELAAQGVVGISGIDTRALTRHLRERGVMRAGIFSGAELTGSDGSRVPVERLVAVVREAPAMVGADLAGEVSTDAAYVVPALGPDGRPIEISVSRVLRIRGQERGLHDVGLELTAGEDGGAQRHPPTPQAGEPGETAGPATPITAGRGPEVTP